MFPKLILTGADGVPPVALERIPLASSGRNEAWLRDFLLQHPEALPAAEIDLAYADPIPVCREMSTPAGPIDAVFVNARGALIIVECKLWRNPQARREVVGQILDYAKELARWHYEDLQRRYRGRFVGQAMRFSNSWRIGTRAPTKPPSSMPWVATCVLAVSCCWLLATAFGRARPTTQQSETHPCWKASVAAPRSRRVDRRAKYGRGRLGAP